MKITGFIFAAGLGTRPYPLTASKPKALVRYNNKTLLDNALEKMSEAGITDVIVNVHHFPDMMVETLRHHPNAAHIHISDERAYLRDTAGGIKFAEHLWQNSDLLLFYNVDILSDINLNTLIDSHIKSRADATLAVRHRQPNVISCSTRTADGSADGATSRQAKRLSRGLLKMQTSWLSAESTL